MARIAHSTLETGLCTGEWASGVGKGPSGSGSGATGATRGPAKWPSLRCGASSSAAARTQAAPRCAACLVLQIKLTGLCWIIIQKPNRIKTLHSMHVLVELCRSSNKNDL